MALVGVSDRPIKQLKVTVGSEILDAQIGRWNERDLLVAAIVLTPEQTATVTDQGYDYELIDEAGVVLIGGGSDYIAP